MPLLVLWVWGEVGEEPPSWVTDVHDAIENLVVGLGKLLLELGKTIVDAISEAIQGLIDRYFGGTPTPTP